VLFVEGNGVNLSPLVGFFHGKFPVQKDQNGRDLVFQHNGEPFIAAMEIGRAKRGADILPARSLSHEKFSAQIRQRLAATAK
jgi:hypothetical protein